MDRITIEVDDRVAEMWRKTPVDKRKAIVNELNLRIGKELLQDSAEKYTQFLDELQSKMRERGLTEEKLNEILNDSR